MSFIARIFQALFFWTVVAPQSLGLSVIIERVRIVIANSKTRLIWGCYRFDIRARLIFFKGIWSMESTDWRVTRFVSEVYCDIVGDL